jgi:hypothetical protein
MSVHCLQFMAAFVDHVNRPSYRNISLRFWYIALVQVPQPKGCALEEIGPSPKVPGDVRLVACVVGDADAESLRVHLATALRSTGCRRRTWGWRRCRSRPAETVPAMEDPG